MQLASWERTASGSTQRATHRTAGHSDLIPGTFEHGHVHIGCAVIKLSSACVVANVIDIGLYLLRNWYWLVWRYTEFLTETQAGRDAC